MKTLCLLLDANDAEWFSGFLKNRKDGDEYVVAAPTLEGRLIAGSFNVVFNTYENLAWDLDINAIDDAARKKAYQWLTLPAVMDNPAIKTVATFNDYPVLAMHASKLVLSLFEIISAFEFMARMIELEKPDTILCGACANPFSRHFLHMATGTGAGLEREAVKSLTHSGQESPEKFSARLKSFSACQERSDSPGQLIGNTEVLSRNKKGKRVTLFHYGGYYYLDFVDETLELLSRAGTNIVVVNIGAPLTTRERQFFERLSICCIEKNSWSVPYGEVIRKHWRDQLLVAAHAISSSEALRSYFATEKGNYFEGLAKEAICKELMLSEQTIIELMRTEIILENLQPDVVVNHFAYHPEETCYVLPARKLGIPCVTMLHGYNWYNTAVANTFATKVFAVTGDAFKDAISKSVGGKAEDVVVVGALRTPGPTPIPSADIKRSLDLDPHAPLCIFCDGSVTPYSQEFRYKTTRVIDEVLALKAALPRLQIIYRVHHGGDYSVLRKYFKQYRERGILFQTSLDVPLIEIAPAADLVISSASSAISESLLCGAPVIYLCALATRDPMFSGCDMIRVVDSYAAILPQVQDILAAGYTAEEVRFRSKAFFDRVIAGNDGKAHERFAALIMRMASTPREKWKPGFQDWLDRLESAGAFQSKRFNTLEPVQAIGRQCFADRPFVSVIMPAFNRDKLIGSTIESFVNQNYPRDRFEIIVADNNSTDATRSVVTEWQRKSAVPITYIFEGRQGVHYARNTAAKSSRGDILYYTDDDMIAEPDLLSELVKVFALDPMVGTATGRVLPRWQAPPPDWVLKLCYNGYMSIFDELGEGIQIGDHDFGVYSCHQALRREAFFRAGGYNPESTFTDYIGDGETGLNLKLKELGYKFGYNGKSVIYHIIPPARMTQDYLNKRLANQGSADCYTEYKKHRFDREGLAQRVNRYKNAIIDLTVRSVIKRRNGDLSWRMDKAQTHYYLNRIEYDLRLMEDASWRELVLKDNWLEDSPEEVGVAQT